MLLCSLDPGAPITHSHPGAITTPVPPPLPRISSHSAVGWTRLLQVSRSNRSKLRGHQPQPKGNLNHSLGAFLLPGSPLQPPRKMEHCPHCKGGVQSKHPCMTASKSTNSISQSENQRGYTSSSGHRHCSLQKSAPCPCLQPTESVKKWNSNPPFKPCHNSHVTRAPARIRSSLQYLRQTSLFLVLHLKLKWNWTCYILSSNPTSEPLLSHRPPPGLPLVIPLVSLKSSAK